MSYHSTHCVYFLCYKSLLEKSGKRILVTVITSIAAVLVHFSGLKLVFIARHYGTNRLYYQQAPVSNSLTALNF